MSSHGSHNPAAPDPPAGRARRWVSRHRRRSLLGLALAVLLTDASLLGTGGLPGPHRHPARIETAAPGTTSTTATSTTTTSLAPTTTDPTTTVTAAPSGGSSTAASPDPTSSTAAAGSCPAGACVTLDATTSIGPADHAAEGLNLLPSSYTDTAQARALGFGMYRSTVPLSPIGNYDWTSWDAAVGAGMKTTLILSDLWAEQFPGNVPPTPWSDWTRYTGWVRATVQNVLASGQRVDYWDVYNEPGWFNYYSHDDFESETPQELLQQFLVTYQTIKSVDPSAAIIGPSLGAMYFSPLPPNQTTHEPDMTTFLDFAAAHGLQLAAVAWHENGMPPYWIYNDAMKVEALIRSHPQLGDPPMFLDEYGSSRTQPIPGWDVGFLSMITDVGFLSAVRSCWDTCTLATLDGLLMDGGRAPTSEYYVRTTYARMSGTMIKASGTDQFVPALGSISADGHQVVALIGRSQGCAVESWCTSNWWPGVSPVGPMSVRVSVVLPWTTRSLNVKLSYEPFQPGSPSSGPITATPAGPTLQPDGPGREILSFTIPAFADGSAYNLYVTEG